MEAVLMYQYEEALAASTEYFNQDDLAAKVFVDKYALRNKEGKLLELIPDDMHKRIAKELARVERKKYDEPMTYDEIYECLKGFHRIVPQGSPMSGIGNKHQYITLSNCYVLHPPEDSYGSILHTDEELVQISKRRGGVGIDLSKLRPNNTPTTNAARMSTGPISFAKRYSNSIREVGQSGRRGALMMTMNVHHPDILDFITCKQDKNAVTGANISVLLTNEFLEAVENDTEYEQRWPVEGEAKISKQVSARKVWHEIIKNAHAHAEPGLLFWDKILTESPADCYAAHGFETVSTNPCSEIPLCVLDSCRLLLVNTFTYVDEPFTYKSKFNFTKFYADAKIAQRLMDDIIDLEVEAIDRIITKVKSDPEDQFLKDKEIQLWQSIRDRCLAGRRTGTGVTAIGDTIAALGLKYGSNRSIEIVEKIYLTLKFACYESSVDMAQELGPFLVYNATLERDNEFLNRIKDEELDLGDGNVIQGSSIFNRMKRHGRRNIALLTTAPAGSVSIQTQTTSGIEPLFNISFTRKKKGNPGDDNFRSDFVDETGDHWMWFDVYHPKVKMWMEITGNDNVEESPWHECCANDLNWKQRVKLQAAAQKHVDHAISSTVNLPANVTINSVKEIYVEAWKAGCKGMTVYRAGSRAGVLVDSEDKEFSEKRPKRVDCDVYHISVKGEPYFVLVGLIHNRPYEVFAGPNGFSKKAKRGQIVRVRKGVYKAEFEDGTEILPQDLCSEEQEAITRLTSEYLHKGGNILDIVRQLEKTKGDLTGFAKSVARALKKYIPNGTKEDGEQCEQCGDENIIRQEGCKTCMSCGWSKCA